MSWWAALLDPTTMVAGLGGSGALGFVGAKFHKMETEIRECRARDSRFVVIEAGFRMVVGEMAREHPNSVALQMCGDLLNRKLGPTPSVGDLNELLGKLEDQPGVKEPRNAHRTPRP